MQSREDARIGDTRRAAALRKLYAARAAEAEAMTELLCAIDSRGAEDPADLFLSAKELAERVPYSEATLRGFTQDGTFQEGVEFFQKRRRLIFSWNAVCAWLRTAEPGHAEDGPGVFPPNRRHG